MLKIRKPNTLELFPEDKDISSEEIEMFLQVDPQQVKESLFPLKLKEEEVPANTLAYHKKMSPSSVWFKIKASNTDVYVRPVEDIFVLIGVIDGEEKGCPVLVVDEEQYKDTIYSAVGGSFLETLVGLVQR